MYQTTVIVPAVLLAGTLGLFLAAPLSGFDAAATIAAAGTVAGLAIRLPSD